MEPDLRLIDYASADSVLVDLYGVTIASADVATIEFVSVDLGAIDYELSTP